MHACALRRRTAAKLPPPQRRHNCSKCVHGRMRQRWRRSIGTPTLPHHCLTTSSETLCMHTYMHPGPPLPLPAVKACMHRQPFFAAQPRPCLHACMCRSCCYQPANTRCFSHNSMLAFVGFELRAAEPLWAVHLFDWHGMASCRLFLRRSCGTTCLAAAAQRSARQQAAPLQASRPQPPCSPASIEVSTRRMAALRSCCFALMLTNIE